MTKAQLYSKVEVIRGSLNISDFHYPLDMFDLCRKINGIEVATVSFKTKGLRGMVSIADSRDENNVILINNNRSFPEQNYCCAHEFMHLFDDNRKPGDTISCYDTVKPNQNLYAEWVANEGAAELLVPYKTFIPSFLEVKDIYIDHPDWWDIFYGKETVAYTLARQFNVSERVIMLRIKNLSYEIAQYENGVRIDDICILSKKQQERQNISAVDYAEILEKTELERFFAPLFAKKVI